MAIRILPLSIFLIMIGLVTEAQSPYWVLKDPKHPEQNMPVGAISRYLLTNDNSYSWFVSGSKGYKPPVSEFTGDTAVVAAIHFLIFAGTWCDDSQFILPRFYSLIDALGVKDDHISLFAVDRDKKSTGNISSALKITNVPTMIVLKNGVEIGRVVEYGKTGKWEEELLQLIK